MNTTMLAVAVIAVTIAAAGVAAVYEDDDQ